MKVKRGRKNAAKRGKGGRRSSRRLYPILAIALVLVAIYVFQWTSVFSLEEVRFHGSGCMPVESLNEVAKEFVGRNLLTIPLSSVRAQFMSFPQVKDVEFRRRLFHRLDCYLKNREPVALVVSSNISEIDSEGVIIPRKVDSGDIDLPVITGVGEEELETVSGKEKVNKALEVLRLLKMFGFSPAQQLSEIHIENDEVVLFWMGTGTLVRMGNGGYPDKVRKLRAVYRALNENEGFPRLIDLRFDHQVIVR
jgi:cell division protein FtsQ